MSTAVWMILIAGAFLLFMRGGCCGGHSRSHGAGHSCGSSHGHDHGGEPDASA